MVKALQSRVGLTFRSLAQRRAKRSALIALYGHRRTATLIPLEKEGRIRPVIVKDSPDAHFNAPLFAPISGCRLELRVRMMQHMNLQAFAAQVPLIRVSSFDYPIQVLAHAFGVNHFNKDLHRHVVVAVEGTIVKFDTKDLRRRFMRQSLDIRRVNLSPCNCRFHVHHP